MIGIYSIAWLGLVVVAIANGAARTMLYGKYMKELTAHQISCFTGMTLIGLSTWILNLVWKLESAGQAAAIGLIWLGLTIAFEFLFGHYVMKQPWSRLRQDYDITRGRLWLLVLIWTAIVPYVVFALTS
jgi:hypothetical protein